MLHFPHKAAEPRQLSGTQEPQGPMHWPRRRHFLDLLCLLLSVLKAHAPEKALSAPLFDFAPLRCLVLVGNNFGGKQAR